MKKLIRNTLLLVAMLFALPAQAANVLYGYDFYLGANSVSAALTAGGHTVTTVTDDWTTFNSDLAGGGFDLVIAIVQNSSNGVDEASLSSHIAGGGRAILTDWTQTASFATMFEASYTGNTNDSSSTFDASIGVANPVAIINPGWGIFSMGLAPTGGGVSLCTASPSGDSCLVQGNGGNTILLGFLTDIYGIAESEAVMRGVIALVAEARPAIAVPTMSQWALMVLALLLLMAGITRYRRSVS